MKSFFDKETLEAIERFEGSYYQDKKKPDLFDTVEESEESLIQRENKRLEECQGPPNFLFTIMSGTTDSTHITKTLKQMSKFHRRQ